jgi:hypothetical protein
MEADDEDPPLVIKKIDVSSLGTLAQMSNAWYEVEEKEDDEEDDDDDGDHEPIVRKTVDVSLLGTLASDKNSWYEEDRVSEDGEEEAEDGEDEEDVIETYPEVSALQLMNTSIDGLIESTHDLESVLSALLIYSQNLQSAVRDRLNSLQR